MKIKTLVETVEDGSFDPKMIQEAFVFLQLYQGRTLMEVIAEQPDSGPVLLQTLMRYLELVPNQEPDLGVSHRAILCKYFFYLAQTLADQNLWDENKLILLYEKIQEFRPNRLDDMSIDLPDYFAFFKELQPEPRFFETPFLLTLRRINLSATIGREIRGIDSLQDVPIERLLNCLERLISKAELSESHTPSELLIILYNEGSEALQADIAAYIDQLHQSNPDNTLLHQQLLINLAPQPLGRAIPVFRTQYPPLLSRLQPSTIILLMGAVPDLLSCPIDRSMMRALTKTISEAQTPITCLLSNTQGPHPDRKLSEGGSWMAFILCTANLPQVENVEIPSGGCELNDRRLMLSLMGSKKLIMSYQWIHARMGVINDLDFYQVFSPSPPQFRIQTLYSHSYLNSLFSQSLFRSLRHGIRNLRFHEDNCSYYEALPLTEYKNHLWDEEDQLVCQFSQREGPSADILINPDCVKPGPLSFESRHSMAYCAHILSRYAPKVLEYYARQVDPCNYSQIPIACPHNLRKEVLKLLQDTLNKNSSKKHVWALMTTSKHTLHENTFLYDCYVFADHLELGPLSRLGIGDQTLAHQDCCPPPPPCPSLFILAAKKFLTLPNRTATLPEYLAKELDEIEKFGVSPLRWG